MSIGQVLLILWRRGWIVALAFLTAVSVAAAVLYFVPGRYDATATASIDPSGLDPVSATPGGSATAIGLMQETCSSLFPANASRSMSSSG